jgi:serine protease Do
LDDGEDKIELGGDKPKDPAPAAPMSILGLSLTPITDEMRTKFGFDPKVKGLIVTEIDPQSPASGKNIKVGDVVVEAQQEAIASPDDLNRAIDKVKKTGGKQVLLLVEDSKGDTRFVALPF